MAKKTVLVDDLTGAELETNEQGELVNGETLEFSLNGTYYNLDLSDESIAKFTKAVNPFIEKATQVEKPYAIKATVRKNPAAKSDGQAAAVKAWGAETGYVLTTGTNKGKTVTPDLKGRIPSDLQEAYDAAHSK